MPGISHDQAIGVHDEPTADTTSSTTDTTAAASTDGLASPIADETAGQNDSPTSDAAATVEHSVDVGGGTVQLHDDYGQAPVGPRELSQTDRLNKQLLQSLLQRMQSDAKEQQQQQSSSDEADEADWS